MDQQFQAKILPLPALVAAVGQARAAGKTIVHCHGCFDIVHPGHVRYLEFARRQGDVLVVSLTGDGEVSKGAQRPYIPQDLRAENLAALMFVDYVYINPEPTAEKLLAALRPDIYVKGREYEQHPEPGFLAEARVVEAAGGRIIFSSGDIVFSSTKLIGQLPQSNELEVHRLTEFCRRYGISAQSIDRSLERFRELHVVVVGDTILDRYVFCDAHAVASESPMLSLLRVDERSFVAGAAIVARHIAALGVHAVLVTSGGTDPVTKDAVEVLRREGVEVHLMESRPSLVEKTRFIAADTKLFKVDSGARLPLDSVQERQAALVLEQQAKLADAVVFCDFGYGMITGGLLSRALPVLRHNVRTISADVSSGRANLLEFAHVDLLCPTEQEARVALNDHDSGLSSVAWNLLHRTQARHVFLTLEKRGIVVFERRSQMRGSPEWSGRLRSEQLPSFAEHPIDRLGCGDSLLAASTLSLAAGDPVMQSAYLGNAAAAIKIAMMGNEPVNRERLREWAHDRAELRVRAVESSPKSLETSELGLPKEVPTVSNPRPEKIKSKS